MDSNRRKQEKQVRVIPCGSVARARTIINNPRFFDVEAIVLRTGTNDLEDNSLSSRHIVNALIEISETALNKFQKSKIFLSEITPRRDEFHLKGMEVNSMVKGAIESNNFQLVCHSNLSKESLFFDKKHLNKFSGVQMIANNFGEYFAKSFSNWMIKKATIVQQRHLPFVRKPFDPSQQIPLEFNCNKVFNLETDKLCLHHNQCINSHCLMLEHRKSHKTQCPLHYLLIKMLCQKC